ncbi:MAG: helix-turn-helix domain-containing protein [Candidatus Moranbacteria bacterium]|nr:helix-turn-helix domain-containing protein [Candidatus Moranbacteria bacterium]
MIGKELQSVGLHEKEAKVYLAALELGKGTAQQISLKSGLKRPTTYVVIEDLMQQGLISSFYEGKKQYFVAENPERLVDMLQKQRQEVSKKEDQLKMIMPQLQSINNRQADKPVVKYYEGKEGVISMVQDCTKSAYGQEICMAYSRDAIKNVFDSKTLDKFREDRLSQNIKVRALYTSRDNEVGDVSKTRAVRLSQEDLPIDCDIAIYDNKVRIASLKNRIIGVVIEDKEIAKAFKAIYELAWEGVHSQK